MTLRRTIGTLIVLGLIGGGPLTAQRPAKPAGPGAPLPIPGRSVVAGWHAMREKFGASEPRHDGAAIPEAPPIFSAPAPSVQSSGSRSHR